MNKFARKSFKILMAIFLVYGVLVATHKGEFWPFSIYPMFSQSGNSWTRALVRDVSSTPDDLIWKTVDLKTLAGSPVQLANTGVSQIDFSNYISKTESWNANRKQGLIKMFNPANIGQSCWIIYKISGRLSHQDSVIIKAVPFLLISTDTVQTNPNLPETDYSI
jgi:uncharacterized protein with PQ loop repeat